MRLLALLAGLSIFAGCNSVPRPNTDICQNDVLAGHKVCYNLATDYDDSGNLNPKAVPTYKSLTQLSDVDKDISTDPDGWANLKAYIRNLRAAEGAQ